MSPPGAAAAALVGGIVWLGLSWPGLAVLAAFLVTGSLLTPGGGRRSPLQVLANGGVPALCAVLARSDPGFALAFAGAVAAATADTWSTEIGARTSGTTVLITTLKPVSPGVSGGISALGTAAGLAGAVVIAAVATALGIAELRSALWIVVAGLAGSLTDSLAGAVIQARWRCSCGALIETGTHGCGGTSSLSSGFRIVTNDSVNFMATLVGAAVAALPSLMTSGTAVPAGIAG
ncbi:MAG TPA: DUF92 domain-containing protein [Gemmatimonadales bacterium]|nr:DUF92 domain-containing protein [Gemmatimonadales bacterium]